SSATNGSMNERCPTTPWACATPAVRPPTSTPTAPARSRMHDPPVESVAVNDALSGQTTEDLGGPITGAGGGRRATRAAGWNAADTTSRGRTSTWAGTIPRYAVTAV